MCGLVAFVSKAGHMGKVSEKMKFMYQGLYLNALRGTDGTGIAVVRDMSKVPIIHKRAMASPDFLQLKMTERVLGLTDTSVAALGHCRSSTRGNTSDENSHPFQYGHITLIHNGHFNNTFKWKKEADSDVDSAQFTYAVSALGGIQALEDATGDFAVIWHDSKEGTINVARNNGRPLYFAEIPEWGGFAFMSELGMLASTLLRLGIKIHKSGFFYPEPNSLLKFYVQDNLWGYEVLPFNLPRTRARGSPAQGVTPIMGVNTTKGSSGNVDSKSLLAEASRRTIKKPKGGTGRPSGNKGIGKATNKLKKYGLNFDEMYAAVPKSWLAYKNQPNHGFMLLEMIGPEARDNNGLMAEVHNVSYELFESIKEIDYVLGYAVNVTFYNKDPSIVLELDMDCHHAMREDNREFLESQKKTSSVPLLVPGPQGVYISMERFKELTKHGCESCQGNCNHLFAKDMLWIGEMKDQPICHVCAADEKAIRELTGTFGRRH